MVTCGCCKRQVVLTSVSFVWCEWENLAIPFCKDSKACIASLIPERDYA